MSKIKPAVVNTRREPVGSINLRDLSNLKIMQTDKDSASGLQSSQGENNPPVAVAGIFNKAFPYAICLRRRSANAPRLMTPSEIAEGSGTVIS